MKQNRQTEGQPLFFENIYDDGEYFWFTEYDFNSLFKMNKINYEVEFIGIFPGEKFVQEKLYISTAICNHKMYFAPYSANEIAIYDLEEKRFEKIEVPIPKNNYHLEWKKMKFFKVIAVENKVYFIPDHYPGILCYDTQTGDLTCFDDWIDKIEKNRKSKWGYFFSYTEIDRKLYLPCACVDAVIIFDTISQKSKVLFIHSTNCECKYVGIFWINRCFYLISADGVITKRKLNSENEKVTQIHLLKFKHSEIEFYPVVCWNNYIYLFPLKNNKVYKIDTDKDEVTIEEMFDEERRIEKENGLFLTCIVNDKKLYAMTVNKHYFIEYDFDTKSKCLLNPIFSKIDWRLYSEYRKQEFIKQVYSEYVIENHINRLDFMLDLLQSCHSSNLENNIFKRIEKGKEIYQSIK